MRNNTIHVNEEFIILSLSTASRAKIIIINVKINLIDNYLGRESRESLLIINKKNGY